MARRVQPLIRKGLLKADLHNLDDVNTFLKRLPEAFKRKFLISILRASTRKMEKSAKTNLKSSVKKGESGKQEKAENEALTKSIATATLPALNKDSVVVGLIAGKRRSVRKAFPDVMKYAVGIEWGMFDGKFSGYGYMRKAFESNKATSRENILKSSRRIIARTQKRYLKQGRYTIF